MAKWNKNKVSSDLINNGDEFTSGDNLAVNELNAIVNNSFYASEKAENAEELAESAVRGNGTLVTINGQIQGEWSADFAESERQKSKNLLGANLDTSHTEFGITFILNTDGSINVNGTATWNATFEMDDITLPAGDYFISVRDVNNNFISNAKIQIYYDGIYKDIENQVLHLDSEKACEFEFYIPNGTTINNETVYIQLEKGSVATDYQPYNGAIVHEKDLEPELLYDNNTKQTIGGMTYPNGIGNGSAINYTINNVDLTPYKYMYVYQRMYGEIQKIFVDLTTSVDAGGYCGGQITLSYNIDALDCSLVKIPTTKDSITFNTRYLRLSDMSLQNTPVNVYRIEVYK